jgi:hypothetical protein
MTHMAQKSRATQMTGYGLEALGTLFATDLCNLSLPPHPHPPLSQKNREDFKDKISLNLKNHS